MAVVAFLGRKFKTCFVKWKSPHKKLNLWIQSGSLLGALHSTAVVIQPFNDKIEEDIAQTRSAELGSYRSTQSRIDKKTFS